MLKKALLVLIPVILLLIICSFLKKTNLPADIFNQNKMSTVTQGTPTVPTTPTEYIDQTPAPPTNNQDSYINDALKEFADNFTGYVPPSINYSNWKTYTNTTHGYSLQYPSTWSINYSLADNVEDYQDSTCCNSSKLTVTNGKTTWELLLDTLYTGGQGWAPESFGECQPKPANTCGVRYEAPMEISGMKLFRKTGFVRATGKILFISIGEINDILTDVKPIFKIPKDSPPNEPRYGSITYTGSSIKEDIEVLDGITLSIKGLK